MDIGKAIIDTSESIRKVQHDFQNFTSYNALFVVMASAICVGMITKETVTDIMNEVVLPLILFLGKRSISYFIYTKALERTASYPAINLLLQKLGHLVWIMIVWILVLYIVYVIFKRVIRLDFVSGKVDLVQNVTGYVTKQEAPRRHVSDERTGTVIPMYMI